VGPRAGLDDMKKRKLRSGELHNLYPSQNTLLELLNKEWDVCSTYGKHVAKTKRFLSLLLKRHVAMDTI
jgi:hypothetical protein